MITVRSRCPRKPPTVMAPTVAEEADSLEKIADDYIRDYRDDANAERDFYLNCESVSIAIDYAANAKQWWNGMRHPHQRQSRKILAEAESRLQSMSVKLTQSTSFGKLQHFIYTKIGNIRMIDDLTVYDIATRIGFYLGLEPKTVWLHAGTKKGATALGLGRGQRNLKVSELPEEFARLLPREIEDCLCIYFYCIIRLDRS
jgi:hypothetical protein